MNTSVLLHIPHSATFIPPELRSDFCLTDAELLLEQLRMTDSYVNEFALSELPQLCFPVSRLVCDVERFRNDADESMAAVGMGAIYTHGSQRQCIRSISPERKEEILRRYYDVHHGRFTQAVADLLLQYGECTILDLHSFASTALPYEQNDSADRPEICIGTDAFHTPDALANCTERFFAERGYFVGRNTPFSGAIVPLRYYGVNACVRSIMLELRRDLYMDENSGVRLSSFLRLKADVQDYQRVLTDE